MYILYILFTHMHAKAFLLHLKKAWERPSNKRRKGEIGKHKLTEMGTLNMK